jgi:hypothetical protein
MRVDVPLLKKVIQDLYTQLLFDEDEAEECLMFNIICGNYKAFAALKIFSSLETKDEEMQGISFSLHLSGPNGKTLDFRNKDFTEVALLCTQLQQCLDWSILSPCKTPNGAVEITLYRSFHASRTTLTEARSQGLHNELITALVQLSRELEYIAPVLQHYADTKVFDLEMIDFFLIPQGAVTLS